MDVNLPAVRAGLGGLAALAAPAVAAPATPPTVFTRVRSALRRYPKPAQLDPLQGNGAPNGHTAAGAPPATSAAMQVVDTVPVGQFPTGIAVSPHGDAIYVVNTGTDTVTVVETATCDVVKTIPVGARPYGIALSADGRQAFVVNGADGTVSVIELPSAVVSATIPVGRDPYDLDIYPDGRHLIVTNQSDATVSVLDVAGGAAAITITVGREPTGVAVHPNGRHAYVVNNASGTVSVIDTVRNEVTATIAVGNRPARIAIAPDGRSAFVTNVRDRSLSVVDLCTGVARDTILLEAQPIGVALSRDGRAAYVAAVADADAAGEVCIVDVTAHTTLSVPVGSPYGVVVDPRGARAYVTDFAADQVAVISAVDPPSGIPSQVAAAEFCPGRSARSIEIDPHAAWVGIDAPSARIFTARSDQAGLTMVEPSGQAVQVAVGQIPSAVTVAPDRTRAYVSTFGDGPVSVVDTDPGSATYRDVLQNLDVGPSRPTGVLLSRDGCRGYVIDDESGRISVIDTAPDSLHRHAVLRHITLGVTVCDVKLSPDGTRLYAITGNDPALSVIDTVDGGLTRVDVGDFPYRISLDPHDSRLYLNLLDSGSVCVVDVDRASQNYLRVISTLDFGDHIGDLVFSREGGVACVAHPAADALSVIDTATSQVRTVEVGRYPWDVAVGPNGARAYALSLHDNSVTVVDTATATVAETLRVGRRPCRITLASSGLQILIANHDDDSVSAIDIGSGRVRSIAVGPKPFDITVGSDSGTVIVQHRDGVSLLTL